MWDNKSTAQGNQALAEEMKKMTAGTQGLTLEKFGKTFEVKETNGKFFYFSRMAGRWLPVKKSEVSDIRAEVAEAEAATKH